MLGHFPILALPTSLSRSKLAPSSYSIFATFPSPQFAKMMFARIWHGMPLAMRDHRDRFNFSNFVIVHANFPVKRIVNEEGGSAQRDMRSMRISICIYVYLHIFRGWCVFLARWTMMDKWYMHACLWWNPSGK